MKALTSVDLFKTPLVLKITAFILIFITFFYLGRHWSSNGYQQLIFFSSAPQKSVAVSPNFNKSFNVTALIAQTQFQTSPIQPPPMTTDQSSLFDMNWTFGILDSDGRMRNEFEVGEFDPEVLENWGNETGVESGEKDVGIRVKRFELCPESMREYIPCLDNVEAIKRLNSTERGEKYERHCPEEGKGLNCLVPQPKGYRQPIPWPRSRDERNGGKEKNDESCFWWF